MRLSPDEKNRHETATNRWVSYRQPLQFMLGSFCLAEIDVPGITLDIPFTSLTTDTTEFLPQWRELSSKVRVAVVSGQPVEKDLPRITWEADAIRYVTVNENRYYIDLRGSFEDYLKKFSSKSRGNLKKSVRRFYESCGEQNCFREFHSTQELDDFLNLAQQVSRKTYQEKIGQGFPQSDEFRNRVMSRAQLDEIRGYVLFHSGRPVAYVFCEAQGQNLVYEHLGYDPEFSAWAPGRVLLYVMLQSLFAERRFELLDFGGSEHYYKKFFATNSVRCARVHYFRRNLRNLSLVLTHSSVCQISLIGAKLLKALRLKEAVKKFSYQLELKQRGGPEEI